MILITRQLPYKILTNCSQGRVACKCTKYHEIYSYVKTLHQLLSHHHCEAIKTGTKAQHRKWKKDKGAQSLLWGIIIQWDKPRMGGLNKGLLPPPPMICGEGLRTRWLFGQIKRTTTHKNTKTCREHTCTRKDSMEGNRIDDINNGAPC